MYERFEAESLDAATLEYLQAARERHGVWMPGVYFETAKAKLAINSQLIWAAICGPILVLVTLWLTWGSLADPINTALFQTAGFLLGGWMSVAWLRVLLAQNRSDFIGYFKYVDPLYIWVGQGRGVEVRAVDLVRGAYTEHNFDTNGLYKYTTVKIKLADGGEALDVKSQSRSERLAEFLAALAEQTGGTPAERGYRALSEVEAEDSEDGEGGDYPRIKEIPRPQREKTSFAWLMLLFLPGVAAGLFLACKELATRQRDEAYFEMVMKSGQPNELRAYLADRRNTRHREAVQKRLRDMAEGSATRAAEKGDLGKAIADLVRTVAGDDRPVITMHIHKLAAPADMLSPDVLATMNRQLVQAISEKLTHPLVVGQGVADFGEVDQPPAMIEIKPRLFAEAGKDARIDWDVTIQSLQEGQEEKKFTMTLSTTEASRDENPWPAVRAAYLKLGQAFDERLQGGKK